MPKFSNGHNFAALKVSLIYASISVLWILFSDQLLLMLVSEPQLMTRIQMVKGWIFVLMTSLIIYILLYREITKVVRAEKLLRDKEHDYRQVFNATNEGIVIHDAETGEIVDVNLPFEKMFGYTLKELRAMNIGELSFGLQPYTREEAEKLIRLAVDVGPQIFEWRCRRRNGDIFWSEVTLKEAYIANKRRVIAVVRNVDDRKLAEQRNAELEQHYQQAQKMEAIGTLAGGVAHDFNNILSAVLGYADLARTQVDEDSVAARHLKEVTRAGNRAKELVKQILSFSRRNQPAPVPLLLQTAIPEAMQLLRASIPTTIQIEMSLDDNCGPVLADPTQIHRVVMNLCTNAYYAMREKGGRLSVSLEQVHHAGGDLQGTSARLPAGEYLRLTVADTGVGMSPELEKKIFEPYFTTKAIGEGTGMGLSVVHGIVSSLGGGIAVHSRAGEGTVFEVYFPANMQELTRDVRQEPPETRGTGRILLVDDEEPLTDLGRQMLEAAGYSVVVETDSSRALELFRRDDSGFDLIITDMNMPHLDGLRLMKRCRELAPTIPVILYTGYSDLVDRERVLEEGGSEFLLKPVTRHELVECVERVLGGVGKPFTHLPGAGKVDGDVRGVC